MTSLKVERIGGTYTMTSITECCSHCGETAKSRRREFSTQAFSALIHWGEILPTTIDKGICDHCYSELRDVLIDRADELTNFSFSSGSQDNYGNLKNNNDEKSGASSKGKPSGARSRVRKAG